ncbi:hypothetical protein SELMODRAFT_112167 [Selaginella moellendorffii]|uniref:alpha-L-fucosidase n=1 Tax=Selaginella moellendorffii TaxID=88036 RepID=D8S9E9_SELML|nr:alpha-L-fucosidase 1 [Selaginella moellendorffii]EFJ18952.1 hypothetical protein SELMODRAFT_112167 [Selaginella moellendorffii]|eukprot:XP_002980082.1 alpha-L-fucosidase 1 [Selaginella moellendorffii]
MNFHLSFLLLEILVFLRAVALNSPPPLPLRPIPSWRQLQFHSRRLSMFFHFGVNTFTDSERGSGHESPSIFNPERLNASQWMDAAQSAGAQLVILTVKHHDGFCLWPSAYTNFSVASSSWRGGKGDVVAEFVAAARERGLDVGFYLSPWDLHESCYGDTLLYNEFYLAQLRELLTGYGPISEVWLDGAKSPTAVNMSYDFELWFDTIHQLQPGANIFSDAGPDIRWVGNEYGEAGQPCWAMANRSSITIGRSDGQYLMSGESAGTDWLPPECDISIRPGWFWHRNEAPKSLEQLLDVFYKSSARNCLLLLNVPPNSSGLIDESDFQTLERFSSAIDSIFSVNLAANPLSVTASSVRSSSFGPKQILDERMETFWAPMQGESTGWIELDLGKVSMFNALEIREPVNMGQRVMEYHVEAWDSELGWYLVSNGSTIGYRKVDRLEEDQVCAARLVRLLIDTSRGDPLICFFGLYFDMYNLRHLSSI